MYSILISDGLDEKGKEILKKSARVIDSPAITPEELLKTCGEYDAIIVRSRTKITPAVFDEAKKLKVVGRAGVGVDNINLESAKAHQVAVVNAPESTSVAVAELAFGLMLAMARELPRADNGMKNGKWLKKELEGVELYGKTLGIIGYGRIGSKVAERAVAFGMQVLGFDTTKTEEYIKAHHGAKVELRDLLSNSDFITLHVPLNDQTRGMINHDTLVQMKPGVMIVSAARGGVIDETALLAALDSGHVAGAALDVFNCEPPGQTALVNHPKLIATPHIGAQTKEAQTRAAIDIANEVLAALNGKELRWKVA